MKSDTVYIDQCPIPCTKPRAWQIVDSKQLIHQCFVVQSIDTLITYKSQALWFCEHNAQTENCIWRREEVRRKSGIGREIREEEGERGWRNREQEMNAETHIFYSIKFSFVTRVRLLTILASGPFHLG